MRAKKMNIRRPSPPLLGNKTLRNAWREKEDGLGGRGHGGAAEYGRGRMRGGRNILPLWGKEDCQ